MKRLLPLTAVLFLASCFHKDVMNDVADDVKSAFVYTGKEGNYIITLEEIFQATSKESGGGFTSISGYAEYRLTSYNAANGNIAARVDLGEGRDENETLILGITDGKLWLYSYWTDLGLHYRDPVTLEVKETQAQLMQKPSLKGIALSKPEWSRIGSFYGFDPVSKRIMISDQQGYKYFLDPSTFAIEKTEADIPDPNWSRNITGNSGELSYEKSVNLEGDPRKLPVYENKKKENGESYLFASYLLDENPLRRAAEVRPYADSLDRRIDSLKKREAELAAIDPQIADEHIYSYRMPAHLRDAKEDWEETRRKLQSEKYQAERYLRDMDTHSYYLLSDERGTAFTWSASSVGDTCRAVITKIRLKPDSSFARVWQLKLDDFYFDPDKADNAGAFETVFSDGDPDFGFQWFRVFDGKLILISQLRMAAIDLKSGQLLWNHQL